VVTGNGSAQKSRNSRFQNYGLLFFNRVPYVVILLTRSEIKQGKAGISQPTSSPSIFFLSTAVSLDCQQEFSGIC